MAARRPLVYRVRNTTRNQELSHRTLLADSFTARLVGLLGRRTLPVGEGLHIVPCNSIHTFFMRFPIDVAFLSTEGQVVKTFHALRPWRATSLYPKARSVLELPAGALRDSQTQEGDTLVFEPTQLL
jgi:uncharacterized membrane protein (UPF0127 family)